MDFFTAAETRPYLIVGLGFGVMWLLWLISWGAAALWASRAAKRPPMRQEATYRVLTIAGAVLMFGQFPRGGKPILFWLEPLWLDWVLLVVALGGIAFAWWARIHLGTLWSARVTRKDEHRIVDTGPYGLVRHPIYTGILAALYATALSFPGPFNVAGAAILTLAFVMKARLEERFLMQELGAEAYSAYRARVPMLVPFWPMGK
jgi:protein-S-isoprenylcysteine O-methyltransferase Ste14